MFGWDFPQTNQLLGYPHLRKLHPIGNGQPGAFGNEASCHVFVTNTLIILAGLLVISKIQNGRSLLTS